MPDVACAREAVAVPERRAPVARARPAPAAGAGAGAAPSRPAGSPLPLDAQLARCVARRAPPARGGLLARTHDDAVTYLASVGATFVVKPSVEDIVGFLVTLARAGDPRFDALKQALVLNTPPAAVEWLEQTLKARLEWVMLPAQRAELLADDLPDDDDEDVDYESDYKAPKQRARAPGKLPQTMSTTDTFKGKGAKAPGRRTKGAGAITGTLETIAHVGGAIQRPTSMSGFIDPQATTGRPNAPEPSSGIRVGVQAKLVDQHVRNSGIIDAQKGHIMALELGGPDKPWNIVPQWANWQGNGVWRKAEVAALKLAEDAATRGNLVKFDAQLFYKTYATPEQSTLKGLTFPTAFKVVVQEFDKKGQPVGQPRVMFDAEQHRDVTDEKIANRVFDALEPDDDAGQDDSDPGMDVESAFASPH